MTLLSTSNHSGSVSTSRPSMSNSTPSSDSGTEVLRLGMMDDQRIGGLLGGQLELLRQGHADSLGGQQPHHLGPVLQVRAGRVAESVPAAPVAHLQKVVQVAGIVAAEAQLGADPLVPVLGQRLG